jgi:hypothetical protein
MHPGHLRERQMGRRILKQPPPFLFRYRPPDEVTRGYFEGLLRENHIWASPPRGFSDWHDCRAQIDFERPQAEWIRYWNEMFKKLGLRGEALSEATREAIATGVWKDPSKHAEIGQGIQGTLDNSGVICLTDTPLDKRMWDEYATGQRGICLCFESSEPPFSLMHDVNYVAELPTVKFNAAIEEQIEAFLLTKGSSYSWECEWRKVDYNKGGGYKPISPWALRAIVLGGQVEASVRDEVVRLVSSLKPDVVLFAIECGGPDLRLQLLAEPQSRIIPPIQESLRNEPVWRPESVRLLDYLGSILPENRRRDLDSRIELLAAGLKDAETSQGKRSHDGAAGAGAVVREATELVHVIIDRSGAAISGYGEVAVLLYKLVFALAIKH